MKALSQIRRVSTARRSVEDRKSIPEGEDIVGFSPFFS